MLLTPNNVMNTVLTTVGIYLFINSSQIMNSEYVNNIKTNVITSVLFLINKYSEKLYHLKNINNNIYNTKPQYKFLIDNTCYYFNYLKSIIGNYSIEPKQDYWICMNKIIEYETNKISNFSTFLMNFDLNEPFIDDIVIEYEPETNYSLNEEYILLSGMPVETDFNELLNKSYNSTEKLLICKYGNEYIYRVFNKSGNSTPIPPTFNNKKTPLYFITIQYTHPQLDVPIDITLDKSTYIVDNEILSDIFIKRYLSYQPHYYIFDTNYSISIMDNDINTFYLNSNQYIKLNESNYEIIDTTKTIKFDELNETQNENNNETNDEPNIETQNETNEPKITEEEKRIRFDSLSDDSEYSEVNYKEDNYINFLYNPFSYFYS